MSTLSITFDQNLLIIPSGQTTVSCEVTVTLQGIDTTNATVSYLYIWRLWNPKLTPPAYQDAVTTSDSSTNTDTQNLSSGIYVVDVSYSVILPNSGGTVTGQQISQPLIVAPSPVWEMMYDLTAGSRKLKFGLTPGFVNFLSANPGIFDTPSTKFSWILKGREGEEIDTYGGGTQNVYNYATEYPESYATTAIEDTTDYVMTFNISYTTDPQTPYTLFWTDINTIPSSKIPTNLFSFTFNGTSYQRDTGSVQDTTTIPISYYKSFNSPTPCVTFTLDPSVNQVDSAASFGSWYTIPVPQNYVPLPAQQNIVTTNLTSLAIGTWTAKVTAGNFYQERTLILNPIALDHMFNFTASDGANIDPVLQADGTTVLTLDCCVKNVDITTTLSGNYEPLNSTFGYYWSHDVISNGQSSNIELSASGNIANSQTSFTQTIAPDHFPETYYANVYMTGSEIGETRKIIVHRKALFTIVPSDSESSRYVVTQNDDSAHTTILKTTYDSQQDTGLQVIMNTACSTASDTQIVYEYAMMKTDLKSGIWSDVVSDQQLPRLCEGVYVIQIRQKDNTSITFSRTIELRYTFEITVPTLVQQQYQITDTPTSDSLTAPVESNVSILKYCAKSDDTYKIYHLVINVIDSNIVSGSGIVVQCSITKYDPDINTWMPVFNQSATDTTQFLYDAREGLYKVSIQYTEDDELVQYERILTTTMDGGMGADYFDIKFRYSEDYVELPDTQMTIDNITYNVKRIQLNSYDTSVAVIACLKKQYMLHTACFGYNSPFTYRWFQSIDATSNGKMKYYSLTERSNSDADTINNVGPGLYKITVENNRVNDKLITESKLFQIIAPVTAAFTLSITPPSSQTASSRIVGGTSTNADTSGLAVIQKTISIPMKKMGVRDIQNHTVNKSLTMARNITFDASDPEPIITLECGKENYIYPNSANSLSTPVLITNANITTSKSQTYYVDFSNPANIDFGILLTDPGQYIMVIDDDTNKYVCEYMVVAANLQSVTLEPAIQYVSCHEGTGTLTVMVSDTQSNSWCGTNTSIIKYRWHKDDVMVYPSDPNVDCGWTIVNTGNDFRAGHYKVEVKQICQGIDGTIIDTSCIKCAEATICEPFPLVIKLSPIKTSLDKSGSSDGRVNVWVTGGTLPYTHNLYKDNVLMKTTMMDDTFTGLSAGAYRIKVVDAKGCEQNVEFTIIEPEPLTVTLTTQYNEHGAKITATPHGGNHDFTPDHISLPEYGNGRSRGPDAHKHKHVDNSAEHYAEHPTNQYKFEWIDTAHPHKIISREAHVDRLHNGTYQVTVHDSNGHTAKATHVIDKKTLKIRVRRISNDSCTFRIKIMVSGGVGPYVFKVDGQILDSDYECYVFKRDKQFRLHVTDTQDNFGEVIF